MTKLAMFRSWFSRTDRGAIDDDHARWERDYRNEIRGAWLQRAAVGALVVATVWAGLVVSQNWRGRYQQVFQPVAGLSYDEPVRVGGMVVADIAEPLSFQRLDANAAYRFNMSVPVSTESQTGSRPFTLAGALAPDAARALQCLTAGIYYEAASESLDGQRAVAQVILNRVRHPAFPNTVCGVVYSGSTRRTGCQFTFTCDGSLARAPSAGGWSRARAIAQAALNGQVYAAVGQATHYHTLWVAPYWSPSLVKVANIGAHTFYRWKGLTGSAGAFTSVYSGREPVIAAWTPPVDEVLDETVVPDEAIAPAADQLAPIAESSAPAVSPIPQIAPRSVVPTAPPAVTRPPDSAAPVAAVPAERRRPRLATPD